LKNLGVRMVGGVNYERISDEGLLVSYGEKREAAEWLPVDSIVLCAGQEPLRELVEPLQAGGAKVHIIGGADEALELDAKRAIDQGTRLAASL
jgi:2,4-dienoyl-CoA reductase (NADPH2)